MTLTPTPTTAKQIFRQGDEVKIGIKVPSPHNIPSDYVEVLVALYADGKDLHKYTTLASRQGYGKAAFDFNNQIVSLFVEREQSIAFNAGILKGYVLYSFPNTEFPDAAQTSSFEVTLGRVLEGKLLEEDV